MPSNAKPFKLLFYVPLNVEECAYPGLQRFSPVSALSLHV